MLKSASGCFVSPDAPRAGSLDSARKLDIGGEG